MASISQINGLQITAASALTASFVTGTVTSASFAISSSRAVSSSFSTLAQTANTASYVLNAVSASFATTASYVANASSFPYTGSARITGSLIITGSITQNASTASFGGIVGIGRTPTSSLDVAGTTRLSGSLNTISGSILTILGSGSTQPVFTVQGSQGELFSVTDSLSGSLFSVNDISGLPILEVFSDNTTLVGSYLAPALITTVKNTLTASGAFTVYSLPTASYDGAWFEYIAKSGSNARAGTIMSVWSGSSVNFTETTSSQFGSTSGLAFTVIRTGGNFALTGSVTTATWTIKTIVRSI